MTSNEPSLDVDTSSSILQHPKQLDLGIQAQDQLVPVHRTYCIYDVKVGPKETYQCKRGKNGKRYGQDVLFVSQMVGKDVKM